MNFIIKSVANEDAKLCYVLLPSNKSSNDGINKCGISFFVEFKGNRRSIHWFSWDKLC